MRSCESYQSIKDEDYEEYKERVDACFSELCDIYADEIESQGLNAQQRANLMERARKLATKMTDESEE